MAIHGASVGGARGDALIVGPSGAGKTTLALGLAAYGYTLAGDDLAVFDRDTGRLEAVARCAHIDARSARLLRRVGLRPPAAAARLGFVTPGDLGGLPRPLRPVLFIALEAGTGKYPRVQPLSQAELLVRLLGEVRQSHVGRDTISDLVSLVGDAGGVAIHRGELRRTLATVAEVLGPPPVANPPQR